jgi:hypothetical protein
MLAPSRDPLPRIVTGASARSLGFTDGQVRTELARGRWQRLLRGIYLTRMDRPERADWIAAGITIAGGGAVVSGWDAVRAWGIGSDRAPVDEVLILAADGTHRVTGRVRIRPSQRAVSAVRLPIADGGFGSAFMADAARAVADTALVYRRFDPVRALVTSSVQRRLCTPEQLQRELDDGPQNGSAHLRRAIDDVLGGAESISEAEFAVLMRAADLPHFELNVPIVDQFGRELAVADALWRDLRAVLEVDSKKHHFYDDKWMRTMRRHNRLTRFGLALTHYPPGDLRTRPAATAAELDAWLQGRAAELGVPYRRASSDPISTPRVRLTPEPYLVVDQQA